MAKLARVLAALAVVLVAAMAARPAEAAWWKPKPGAAWQIQYTGAFKQIRGVTVYNLDLFETSSGRIARLQAKGYRVICYFSAGSFEEWRPDAGRFPESMIGAPYEGWDGEWWLDIRRTTIKRIMATRLDLARDKGCDAVDPDNVNGYENETGFPLTYADQLSFNKYLAREAHRRGLAIGLKNDLSQIPDLVRSFDFAVNESCFDYDECDVYAPFVAAGKPVYQIQYPPSDPSDYCDAAAEMGFDTLFKEWELGPEYVPCP